MRITKLEEEDGCKEGGEGTAMEHEKEGNNVDDGGEVRRL